MKIRNISNTIINTLTSGHFVIMFSIAILILFFIAVWGFVDRYYENIHLKKLVENLEQKISEKENMLNELEKEYDEKVKRHVAIAKRIQTLEESKTRIKPPQSPTEVKERLGQQLVVVQNTISIPGSDNKTHPIYIVNIDKAKGSCVIISSLDNVSGNNTSTVIQHVQK